MDQDLPGQTTALREVLLQAGERLISRQCCIGPVSRKSATELITTVDREVEECVLEMLRRAFPGDGLLAEEGGAQTGSSGRVWYIDPLDGTTNYVHGRPAFCVSLACAEGEQLLLAGIHAPALDELYLGWRGGGAWREQPRAGGRQALPPREPLELTSALLATGFPYRRDQRLDWTLAILRRVLKAGCHGVRREGSAALDLAHVAAGSLDGYWELGLRPWDVAAGTLLAREAGAQVTDLDGTAGLLDGTAIVAASPTLHAQLLAICREVAREQD
jgi:myo-inositol-1(or 4)-monophosphatase